MLGDDKNKFKRYLFFTDETILENEYFGKFKFKKGDAIFFNIKNKLEGFQGSSAKNIDDWWFTVNRLKQLIDEEKIDTTQATIGKIAKEI